MPNGDRRCSRDTSANAWPARTFRFHHWPNRVMAASCVVMAASIRRTECPADRSRTHNSGSSPAIKSSR